jgi:hypothetical protein
MNAGVIGKHAGLVYLAWVTRKDDVSSSAVWSLAAERAMAPWPFFIPAFLFF